MATDGGRPPLSDTSTVIVTVERNLNTPEIRPQNYSLTILSTQNLGIPIETVDAVDNDISVSTIGMLLVLYAMSYIFLQT